MKKVAVERERNTPRQFVNTHQPVRELIKRYRIDAALDRKLKAFAKKLQVSEGYTAELAYRVAFNWARFHWDLVFVNGLVREIKPTRADGRAA